MITSSNGDPGHTCEGCGQRLFGNTWHLHFPTGAVATTTDPPAHYRSVSTLARVTRAEVRRYTR